MIILKDATLASTSTDHTIKLWNTNTGQFIRTLTGHSDSVYSIVELLDSTLASGSGDKLIKIWNQNDGRCIKNLRGHTSWIYSLAVLVDGRLASCSYDTTIKIWDTEKSHDQLIKTLTGHSAWVWSLAVLKNGNLASSSGDKTIKIWSLFSFKLLRTIDLGTDSTLKIASLQESFLACSTLPGNISVFDTNTGQLTRNILSGNDEIIQSLVLLPHRILASSSDENRVNFWNLTDGKLTKTLETQQPVWSLVLLADGRLVTADINITIWK
jgi:WD40 repeat protein